MERFNRRIQELGSQLRMSESASLGGFSRRLVATWRSQGRARSCSAASEAVPVRASQGPAGSRSLSVEQTVPGRSSEDQEVSVILV